MQSLLQNLDELHLHEDKNILKALEADGNEKSNFFINKFFGNNKTQKNYSLLRLKYLTKQIIFL